MLMDNGDMAASDFGEPSVNPTANRTRSKNLRCFITKSLFNRQWAGNLWAGKLTEGWGVRTLVGHGRVSREFWVRPQSCLSGTRE